MTHLATNHGCMIAVVVVLLLVTVNEAESKSRGPKIRTRGCAFYGHSCFGGHGKRSMPAVQEEALQRPYPLKFVQDPMHLEVPGSYDNNIEDNSYSDEAPEQDFKFAVYGLFKQWMKDIHSRNAAARNNAAFELIKASEQEVAAKRDTSANGLH